jgi:hypothetical protein
LFKSDSKHHQENGDEETLNADLDFLLKLKDEGRAGSNKAPARQAGALPSP